MNVLELFLKVQNVYGGIKEIKMMDILIVKMNKEMKLFGE
jgi:hypothetical protein